MIRDLLFLHDPYAGFNPMPPDLRGWHGDDPIFGELVKEAALATWRTIHHDPLGSGFRPVLVIEVGSWLGQSAVSLGKSISSNHGGELVCVDTWLGSSEFWTDTADPLRYGSLGLVNGYPSVYRQFLSNMVHAGLQGVVTPFPQTSTNAAAVLRKLKVQADLIYLDASHEFGDVLADLLAWWPVLKVGCTMFGDDYRAGHPGVADAVNMFAGSQGLEVIDDGGLFWRLVKP